MIFTTAASVLALAVVAVAQDYGGPPPSSGTTTSVAPAAPSAPPNTTNNINIDVAPNGVLVFSAPNITAPVGTQVTFWFPGGSLAHSVTQSSFANPCTYLEATANTSAGFDSGLTNSVQFTINITNTEPIWYHCKQVEHCGLGMVGAINAPTNTSNTFEAFRAAAVQIGGPTEPTQTTGGPVTGGVNGVALSTPANTGSAATPSATSSSVKNIASIGLTVLSVAAVLILA